METDKDSAQFSETFFEREELVGKGGKRQIPEVEVT
jgi:hypothetical protein